MTVPTEADFALVKMGSGGGSETFAILCGLSSVSINRTVATSDRFVPDCEAPGAVPNRSVRVNGRQLDVTGSGLINVDQIDAFDDALGLRKNYKVELYLKDGTDAGELLGTFAAAFVMTGANMTVSDGGESSGEVTLASHGAWTWTAAA